jgi:AcrR family transcriptional regulator
VNEPRRRRRRSTADGRRDVRATLLEATERLLAERALGELAVADILKEAEVSRATFYFYFESKHAILAALLERIVDDLHGATLPYFERGETPPEQALRDAHRGLLALWREHAVVMRASLENWQAVPELRDAWGGIIARFTAAAAAQIERDREASVAQPGPDAARLAGALIAMNERCVYYAVANGDPDDDAALVETLTYVWMTAIYP